ncbi:hypothetical protein Scel_08360 [Streptomyces cellostaticus]|nr:hypothetical protein Scel_08360 [Streptomyces cellostaticus]
MTLPPPHQFGHGADGLGERDGGVAAVHVVEVDDVDVQAAQARLDGLPDVGRVVADGPVARGVGAVLDAELGGQCDLVTVRGDERREELLVGTGAVHVGGVDEGDARLDGGLQGVEGRRVVRLSVGGADAHGPETLDADEGAALAQLDLADLFDGAAHDGFPAPSGSRQAPA